ncbi:hypothetical protein Ssed_2998 [Shewanella sediminis HAW-EB3]|uniref:Uncharacterized protein n=2 Tax=Shewanella sediminis TaxID=271097 RepID=A8FXM9_SHESH|nr:hypothetical protein Ssed_2998 [Shewanella sediminis HAW-EB3]
MRNIYHYCLLIGDQTSLYNELCKSLSFSTHCNYLQVSIEESFELSNHIHMNWMDINSFETSHLPEDEAIFCICTLDNNITLKRFESREELENVIGSQRDVKTIFKSLESYSAPTKAQSTQLLSSFCDAYIKDKKEVLLNLVKNSTPKYIALDFLVDYIGDVNFIGGTLQNKSDQISDVQLLSEENHNLLHVSLAEQGMSPGVKNNTISLVLEYNQVKDSFDISPSLNIWQRHWVLYRAAGINIALILVQNLLARKVKTRYFVNPNDIQYNAVLASAQYIHSVDTVYFDLDETLIWKGQAINDCRALLLDLKSREYNVKLITRHTFPIPDTLKKIDLDETVFTEIIKVTLEQKKSSFISGNALFIDNEFPERLDVRNNCEIPVLDLDQLEFCKFN